ncbi:alkaline phosphatase family protein [Bacillus sp. RO1]|uniref:alkaline phosphatase family protein n=1 Tax=Bacillus sp. RO1 TaxID=2722703 RepID=UPI001456D528|nr:alkaline phosphatase family protein [Bacillus sp. RO1]NLP51659.1 alkaline phosphatase family protein [Bacillus sp. RO1]
MVSSKSKPIIMLVIDTLMDQPLQEAIKGNRAPALKFLIGKGRYFPNVVSPFPTMSVNVDTTILTGTYCNEHCLPGLVWFDSKENRLVNYGSHIRELWKLGISQSLEDILFNMNGSHISKDVKTIHEEIEEKGKKSASINALIYRGYSPHFYKLPKLITWFTKIKKDRPTSAPAAFTYGSLKNISGSFRFQRLWQRFGFNSSFSIQELTHLIKTDQLPAFTIVYFPELDQRVHKHGRMDIQGIEKVDLHLQKLLNVYDTWEEAIHQNIWLTMGDNGQAWIDSNRKKALIDLRKLFGEYDIMKLKKGNQPQNQIVLAVNERMSYIYTLDKQKLSIEELVQTVQNEERIDVIAWRNGSYIVVQAGKAEGELRFRKGGPLIDSYNQSWNLEGDLNLLDLTIRDNKLHYGDYPDALERLYSSLYSHQGDFIVVSAKPGYEFIGEGSPTHVGGASHGGLHKQDSLIPLVVTGTNSQPSYLRMKEIKKWVLSLLDED